MEINKMDNDMLDAVIDCLLDIIGDTDKDAPDISDLFTDNDDS